MSQMSKEEMHQLFLTMYNEKQDYITFAEVCQEVGCCEKTFRKWMKAVDAFDDCPDVFRQIMKTIHVFDTIDEQSAYWLGYLMADGCFTTTSTGNTYRLMLECKTEDKEILENFCDYIGVRKERITTGHNGKSVAMSLADSNFSTSVSQYGIVYNKSHIDNFVPEIIYNNDNLFLSYLHGLFDGDGTVHTARQSHGISIISNSKTLLEEIQNKLNQLLPKPTSMWLLTKDKDMDKKATQDLYTLKIGVGKTNHTNNLVYLYDNFYSKNQGLIRKKELFKSITIL